MLKSIESSAYFSGKSRTSIIYNKGIETEAERMSVSARTKEGNVFVFLTAIPKGMHPFLSIESLSVYI